MPAGVTLIVGGGYHGKSTLLRAIERGVYNHRPGDGRELVISGADLVTRYGPRTGARSAALISRLSSAICR